MAFIRSHPDMRPGARARWLLPAAIAVALLAMGAGGVLLLVLIAPLV